jgi:hypothetical protein
MSKVKNLILKAVSIFFVFVVTYSLALYSNSQRNKEVFEAEKSLMIQHSNLLQNRIALIQFAKTDPSSERAYQIFELIKQSNKKGLEDLEEMPQEEYSSLFERTNQYYQEQRETTFPPEKSVLVQLLTKQTNLILEYQFLIRKLTLQAQ